MPTATNTRPVSEVVTLTPMTCPVCGVVYGLSEEFRRRAQEEGHRRYSWTCTQGHTLSYPGKSDTQIENERLRSRLDMTESCLSYETEARAAAERSNAALKGVVTRTKKRVGNGVCPCCNRSFANLARHMKGQHPDYADSEP